ncbi:MAG: hypothetical protein IT442_05890 [Phycisphaeraceae bacterium]|nr:hypothetical protein [Phycisphaeraceae bacterium]
MHEVNRMDPARVPTYGLIPAVRSEQVESVRKMVFSFQSDARNTTISESIDGTIHLQTVLGEMRSRFDTGLAWRVPPLSSGLFAQHRHGPRGKLGIARSTRFNPAPASACRLDEVAAARTPVFVHAD